MNSSSSMSPTRGRTASGNSSSSSLSGQNNSSSHGRSRNGYKPIFDEERLEWEAAPRWSMWPRRLRFPRLRMRKKTVGLFLFDLIVTVLVICAFEPLITLLVRNEEMFGARLTFTNSTAAPYNASSSANPIPRIFHQTSATFDIPERWVASRQSCKDAYADFEYMQWTDELAREFISAEYPWFLDTWDNYPFPIQRADAIRYFVLYHYGGIYLDMDTICNRTIPFDQIEADGAEHHAVFVSTKPTGVSNDMLISSSHHPLFAAAIAQLLFFNEITQKWARFQPHTAVMISAGPFFLTMTIKDYLFAQPSLSSPTVSVVNSTQLSPYITDLEDCSWHRNDTKALMWIGDHPWTWFLMGAIGLAIGLHLVNHGLLLALKGMDKLVTVTHEMKVAKVL